MEIKQTKNEKGGIFEAFDENGKRAGEMTYVNSEKATFIIDHTEVFPGNEGKGVGKQLVMAGVNYARENDFKIIPLCPFAKSLFEKIESIRDVLK